MAHLRLSILFFIACIAVFFIKFLPDYIGNIIWSSALILLFVSTFSFSVDSPQSQYRMVEMKIYFLEILSYFLWIIILFIFNFLPDQQNICIIFILFLLSFLNFRLHRLQKNHIVYNYRIIIRTFAYIDFLVQQTKYKYADAKIKEYIYKFELIAWPYNGVQFYLRKKEDDIWELTAPEAIAKKFLQDLAIYSREEIHILEVKKLTN
jgi:hypothetical protein